MSTVQETQQNPALTPPKDDREQKKRRSPRNIVSTAIRYGFAGVVTIGGTLLAYDRVYDAHLDFRDRNQRLSEIDSKKIADAVTVELASGPQDLSSCVQILDKTRLGENPQTRQFAVQLGEKEIWVDPLWFSSDLDIERRSRSIEACRVGDLTILIETGSDRENYDWKLTRSQRGTQRLKKHVFDSAEQNVQELSDRIVVLGRDEYDDPILVDMADVREMIQKWTRQPWIRLSKPFQVGDSLWVVVYTDGLDKIAKIDFDVHRTPKLELFSTPDYAVGVALYEFLTTSLGAEPIFRPSTDQEEYVGEIIGPNGQIKLSKLSAYADIEPKDGVNYQQVAEKYDGYYHDASGHLDVNGIYVLTRSWQRETTDGYGTVPDSKSFVLNEIVGGGKILKAYLIDLNGNQDTMAVLVQSESGTQIVMFDEFNRVSKVQIPQLDQFKNQPDVYYQVVVGSDRKATITAYRNHGFEEHPVLLVIRTSEVTTSMGNPRAGWGLSVQEPQQPEIIE